jgi:hypothetical protein
VKLGLLDFNTLRRLEGGEAKLAYPNVFAFIDESLVEDLLKINTCVDSIVEITLQLRWSW